MSRMIGGNLIWGGFVFQTPTGIVLDGNNLYQTLYSRGFPIRQCRLQEQFNERPLFIAGLLGCPTTRRVSFQAQFAFTIWFDADNPLEVKSTAGNGIPSFRERDPFQLVFFAGYNPYALTYVKAYYAPRCVSDTIVPIWDEESDPRKVIGMEVTGHTRGWTFILPDDGNPSDNSTLAGAYTHWIGSNPLL